MRKLDLKGKRFGRLLVVEERGKTKSGHILSHVEQIFQYSTSLVDEGEYK